MTAAARRRLVRLLAVKESLIVAKDIWADRMPLFEKRDETIEILDKAIEDIQEEINVLSK